MAILVHELGHHYDITDHLFLDKLGSKVQASYEPFLESIDLQKYKQEKFVLRAYNYNFNIKEYVVISGLQGRLILENGFDVFDFTPLIRSAVDCPQGEELKGFFFSNMHWNRLGEFDTTKNSQLISVSMDLDCLCEAVYG